MKKFIPLLALLFVSPFSAFAKDATLFGTWESVPQILGGGVTIQAALTFTETGLIATNTCTQGGTQVVVSVTGDYDSNGSVISVTSASENSMTQNGLDCYVTLQPASVHYRVSGFMLELSIDGQTILFNKKI